MRKVELPPFYEPDGWGDKTAWLGWAAFLGQPLLIALYLLLR